MSERDEFPGSDREKVRGYPVLTADLILGHAHRFPFSSWAASVCFLHNEKGLPLFRKCGSAAEAYFIRPFLLREGVTVEAGTASLGAVQLQNQVPCAKFLIDAVVTEGAVRLAIEVDGLTFHHRTKEQVAADYRRQRQIVAKGYTVIRFTAPEVFADASECWRQVDIILAARRAA